jgi:nucleoside-diphosphate-sugar epimerase/predicted dehydrogenase
LRITFGIKVIEQSIEVFFETNTKQYDFALITLPNQLHFRAIELCIAHKIPVLCEKPLTLSLEEAQKIANLAQEIKIPIAVAMVRRLTPSFQTFKAFFHLIGKPISAVVEDGSPYAWTADSSALIDKKNGGVLADMGIHFLDLLYAILGKMEAVFYEDDSLGGVEANCSYQLKSTTYQIPVSLKLSREYNLKNTFEIIGTNGKIWFAKNEFDCAYFEDNYGKRSKLQLQNPFTIGDLPLNFTSCFVEQIALFQMAITMQTALQVAAIDALDTTKLLDWAYQNRNKIASNLHYKIGNTSSKYFITGGNGFIGSRLIEYLADSNHQVSAGIRSYRNAINIAKFSIQMPRFDLLNYEDVKEKVKGHTHIIHLAYASDSKNAEAVNVEGTKNIVQAAIENGLESVLILSTMNVYGFPSGIVTENSPMITAGGIYGKTKKQMQQWCLNEAQKSTKTRITVLNPTCVYGVGGKTYTTLPLQLAKQNNFCYINEGIGTANIVYVDNLIDAMLRAINNPAAHGHNFIINDATITWKDFLNPLLLQYAANVPSFSIQELQLIEEGQLLNSKQLIKNIIQSKELRSLVSKHKQLGQLKTWLGAQIRNNTTSVAANSLIDTQQKINYMPPLWLNDLFSDTSSIFSSEKAQKVLGWKPVISLKTAQEQTVLWLQEKFKY